MIIIRVIHLQDSRNDNRQDGSRSKKESSSSTKLPAIDKKQKVRNNYIKYIYINMVFTCNYRPQCKNTYSSYHTDKFFFICSLSNWSEFTWNNLKFGSRITNFDPLGRPKCTESSRYRGNSELYYTGNV